MSGFGSGPFGHFPFGTVDWAKATLYDALPEPYREASAGQGDYLETWASALAPSFNEIKNSIDGMPDLVDPLKVRSRLQESQNLLLGAPVFLQGTLEQGGLQGSVDSFGTFTAPVGKFSRRDIGKLLQVVSPGSPDNSKPVTITALISPTSLETEPILDVDANLRWSILTKPETPADRVFAEVLWAQDMLKIVPSWKIYDGEVEIQVNNRYWLSGLSDSSTHYLDREATDGVLATGIVGGMAVFLSPSASFTWSDYGRTVSLPSATDISNQKQWTIDAVIDPTTLAGPYVGWTAVILRDYADPLQPAPTIADPGPVYWAALKRPVLSLSGTTYPRGTIDQQGSDLYAVVPGTTVYIQSAILTAANVGDTLRIYGLGGTTDVLEGTIISSTFTVGITTAVLDITVPVGANTRWELRRKPLGGLHKAVIQAYPTSLIGLLGDNFAAGVEYKEREHDQRGWIRTAADWSAKKGWEAYTYAAKYSGFDPLIQHLYKLAISYDPLPESAYTIHVPEQGFSGTKGYVLAAGSDLQLYGSTITDRHVGMGVRISNAAIGANDGAYYEILSVSAGVVSLKVASPAGLAPDYGIAGTIVSPTLAWSVYRLYTTIPPRRPRFDEVAADALLLDAIAFTDMDFAWPITITASTPSGTNLYDITATQLAPPAPMNQVQPVASVGRWWVGTDPLNKKSWVTVVPTLSGTTLTFTVHGLQPSVGGSFLVYDAPIVLSCDYCASYRIWVQLTPQYDMDNGLEAECFERATRRLKLVTPASVELIVQLMHITPVPVVVSTQIVTP